MTAAFELDGQKFVALNGGPQFTFTPAVSFVVDCETQAEVDHFWEKLSAGGKPHHCGWLTHRYCVSRPGGAPNFPPPPTRGEPGKGHRGVQAGMHMDKLHLARVQGAP